MMKYKATIEWRHPSDAKAIRRFEYLEFVAASFSSALQLAQAHVAELPNGRLTRLETA